MIATIIVAALGFAATVFAAWVTTHSQRQGERDARLLDARLRVYGDCATSLYDYDRATFNRVKARLASRPDRDDLRQEAYHLNARVRAAIGQVAILCDDGVRKRLESARLSVGDYNTAKTERDLREKHERVLAAIDEALSSARADLGT